jgi:hypothetical protein
MWGCSRGGCRGRGRQEKQVGGDGTCGVRLWRQGKSSRGTSRRYITPNHPTPPTHQLALHQRRPELLLLRHVPNLHLGPPVLRLVATQLYVCSKGGAEGQEVSQAAQLCATGRGGRR